MATYEGTAAGEQIGGTREDDILRGHGGDDVLYSVPKDSMATRPDGTVTFALPSLADSEFGNDELYGGAGNDVLWAGGGRDWLEGNEGNDRLIGHRGPDVMIGGSGQDTFEIWSRTDAGIGLEADRILDFTPGVDLMDLSRLQNPYDPGFTYRGSDPFTTSTELQVRVEAVQGMYDTYWTHVQYSAPISATPQATATGELLLYGNFQGALSPWVDFDLIPEGPVGGGVGSPPPPVKVWESAEQAMACRLYDTVFDRVPDAEGLRFWTGSLRAGHHLEEVATAFMAAPEWQAKYGTPSNGEFVERLYLNVLNRPGEADGMGFWIGNLEAGLTERREVVVAFSEAPEHQMLINPNEWLPW